MSSSSSDEPITSYMYGPSVPPYAQVQTPSAFATSAVLAGTGHEPLSVSDRITALELKQANFKLEKQLEAVTKKAERLHKQNQTLSTEANKLRSELGTMTVVKDRLTKVCSPFITINRLIYC